MPELRTYAQAYVEICGRHSDEEVDRDRLWAAKRVSFLSRILIEQGWKEYRWTPGKPGPIPRKKEYGGWSWDFSVLPMKTKVWFDHPYRLVNKEKNREIFKVEPYGIEGQDMLADLAWIAGQGWHVDIDANRALHFPGETIAISFERDHL